MVVENRPGANGDLAGHAVANANPDGHTLLLGADTMFAVNPHIRKMAFNPLKDLVPVASAISNQFYISVHPSLAVRDFREFIDYARKTDPPLSYGSAGNGSMHHLSMEMLKQRAGINLLHIPFRGGTAAATAVIGGQVPVMSSGASSATQIQAGQLRGLATTGKTRSPLFPDMPTVGEFYPGYEAAIWLGFFAPAATPEPAIAKLRKEINKVIEMPDVQNRIRSIGMDPLITMPQEFAQLIRGDHEKYGKLIRDIGLKHD